MAPLAALVRLTLVAAFVAGFLLVSSVAVVRGRLLDAGFYSDALVRSDVYERTYTEVLADPELTDLVEDLLGGLDGDRVEPVQARSLATSTLRLALPPSRLRSGTEAFVTAVLAYVRGDVARLDPDLDVSEVLDRVVDAAEVWMGAALASTGDRVTTSVDEYRAAVAELVADLASGTLPDRLPMLAPGTVDPREIVDVLASELGVTDPARRTMVEAATLAGDERDALIDALSTLVATRAADATSELRAKLENGRDLDVVAELADRAGRPRAAVIGRLDTVRDAARWLSPRTAALGVLLMVGSVGGLVWLERRRPRRAALMLAVAAVGAGLAFLALWALTVRLVDPPLAPATEAGNGSWGLPAGLRGVVADVVSSLADDLGRTVRRWALVPIVVGSAVVAGAVIGSRLRHPTLRAVAIGGTAVAGVGAVAWLWWGGMAPGGHVRACNGAMELCGRAYDDVVYAATHNSMSSPDVVSVWPEHDGNIPDQLDAGVRAPLIDTHHWTPLLSPEQLTAGDDSPLPPAVADRVFETLGSRREPREGTYLCHNECALGAIPFVDALVTVREFLEGNPGEVVTLIIQDAISPEETAAAFEAAGLDRYLHPHDLGRPWPTLGELIDQGERLVVFAENEGPPPAWYHQAFANMQDTPFRFDSPEQFSCAASRGDPDAPLFLMNHWISRLTPDRAAAGVVNRHDVIVDRARRCEDKRGRRPNYVAVDFFGIGDLSSAVATLNGLD